MGYDMKSNEVAQNKIHREHVGKELRAGGIRTAFTLSPGRLVRENVADKVNPRDAACPAPPGKRQEGIQSAASMILNTPRATGSQVPAKAVPMGNTSSMIDEIHELLQKPHQTPIQKYSEPQTSAHAIGWETNKPSPRAGGACSDDAGVCLSAHELMKVHRSNESRWRRGRKNTELSTYGEQYVNMYGCSPYNRKNI
eukprot:gnl/MRDRNA2_/MRDRNA2_63038_c0_seq1.p1 gnl/MRDRNA2_/MRDRNA2_63038_c0~~gnl/MRDRNA2_/MRDRNA2_63038_c0_seq1.p1  ORF type:complete len:197 (+),score=35.39 gnl/MRDRNA2_/MRDRNA2_63038_c0_seq1:119-709(+)